jgi:sugar phosphate permease
LFGTGWVREGWLSWYKSYLEATVGLEVGSVGLATAASAISLCGVVGSLAGGYISDRCCGAKRGPVALAYTTLQLVSLAFLWLVRGNAALSVLGSGLLALFFFGALTLLMGAAAADFVDPRLSGMTSGLVNFGQYAGAGVAAVSTGAIVERAGWDGLLLLLIVGPVLSCTAMLWLMWLQRAGRKPAGGAVAVVTASRPDCTSTEAHHTASV